MMAKYFNTWHSDFCVEHLRAELCEIDTKEHLRFQHSAQRNGNRAEMVRLFKNAIELGMAMNLRSTF